MVVRLSYERGAGVALNAGHPVRARGGKQPPHTSAPASNSIERNTMKELRYRLTLAYNALRGRSLPIRWQSFHKDVGTSSTSRVEVNYKL